MVVHHPEPPRRMKLEKSVIATLTYSDHFSFPLTLAELHTRLIKEKSGISGVTRTVEKLIAGGKITKNGKYLCLIGRTGLVGERGRHAELSGSQRRYAKRISYKLSHIPGVLAIYLTGSLAMMNTDGADDIDFLIVTDNGKLWTTRLLMTVYCSLLGIRRTPKGHNIAGKICLNLYLSPCAFSIPIQKRSLYTAYELIQTIPLYDPAATHSELLAANGWVRNFLPNYQFPAGDVTAKRRKPGLLSLFIEKCAYLFQVWYMRKNMTNEYITPDSAFFHPANPGKNVLQKIGL